MYDCLRIKINKDILFMASPKVNISNLKIKLLKFYIQNIFEFLANFRVEIRILRLDSLTFRVKLELESSFDRVEFE